MIIDVHGHISPPESIRKFPMPPSLGDVDGMIEAKLAAGIDCTIVGSPVGAGAMVPIPGVDNYAQTNDELRAFHDWLAGTVADHPDHLRALVYANPFGGEGHLESAASTYRDGGFVGFIVNTSVAGRYLDDPAAESFFGLVTDLDAPVVLHAPAAPAAGAGLTDLRWIEQLGRFSDVTVGVACCVLGGWLEKYPSLQLVATGAGGALALLPEKLDVIHNPPHWARAGARSGGRGEPPGGGPPGVTSPRLSRPPSEYLRRLWVDTASPSRLTLEANLAVFGPERVMLGTDSPPLVGVEAPLMKTIAELTLADAAKAAITGGNAAALFGITASTQRRDVVETSGG
jgi:aminocarboxymuconate-semialdehyde decarboxylase